jgi:hypothetical protein
MPAATPGNGSSSPHRLQVMAVLEQANKINKKEPSISGSFFLFILEKESSFEY